MELLIEYFAKGLMTMLMIAMPCVLTAAGIGLVVGILQAVTQVQEQTIAAAPKIFSVFLVIILLGTGYIKLLSNLFNEGAVIAFDVVPKSDDFVLPSGYYNYTKPFIDEIKFDTKKDMTPMSHILNNAARPQGSTQKEKFNFLRNGATDIPTPNLAEQKVINENKR
ncbi:MAG: flagellar biosynthetic protein FliQ [Candidatus Gastranaerophilales bacterium]|nr:flagellar biosynthetic protein FliQ [Candidatus Gastranaerophilales bacterium]